jgi:hypothetical protein
MTATRTTVLVIAALAILAMPAFAQTPRQNATGGGFAAVSVDETASVNNPAGLPLLQTFGTQISPWPSRASINALVDGPDDYNEYSAFYAGRAADNSSGWGAGYGRSENGFEADAFSLGYGMSLNDGITVGASLFHESWDSDNTIIESEQNGVIDDDQTSFDIGAMYRKEMALNTWRFGLVAEDLADEYGGPFFHVGAGVELPAGVDVAATIFDLSDEIDTTLGIGAEWEVPMSPVVVRAGNFDGDFSAGAAYRWTNFSLDVAWIDGEVDDWFTAGVTGCF